MKTCLISKAFGLSVCLLLAATAVTITPDISISQPRLGIYFDGHRHARPTGQFSTFKGYIYLRGTAEYVTGVEYSLETPLDPMHMQLSVLEVTYPENYSISLGDPFSGHSISYYPPVAGYNEDPIICTITFLAMEGCDTGLDYDWPINIAPHPVSGFLRGTVWPDHELIDLAGETSHLCPCHWPPELSSVEVYSPRCIRAWFNQCVFDWHRTYDDQFLLYKTFEPGDTIDVTHAVLNSPVDAELPDFFVYLDTPMANGVDYTLQAGMCCECNGCATSTRRFVYFDDFPGNADLAVTYWIDYDNGMDLGILVPDGCEEFDVDFKVRNFGSAASLPFESRITAIPRDGGDPVTLWSGSSSGLAVNGTYEGTATIAIPWLPSHRAYLAFEADWDEAVQEITRANNIARASLWTYRPEIVSIEDVPADNGGQVEITFRASMHEVDRRPEGTYYTIWRHDRMSDMWEDVLHLDATGSTLYSCMAPTAIDSNDTSTSYMSVFMIDYSSNTSCPDSGYSVNDAITAVFLQASSVETSGESIVLRWSIEESDDLDYFIVSRSNPGGTFHAIGDVPVDAGQLRFEFEDRSAEPDIEYVFRVEYIDSEGIHFLFETEPVKLPPLPFALHQNRPNPFNPATEIAFSLPAPGAVTLDIYDISGKRIRRLLDEQRPAGRHSVTWSGTDDRGSQAASGVYFYRLRAGKLSDSRKMILLR